MSLDRIEYGRITFSESGEKILQYTSEDVIPLTDVNIASLPLERRLAKLRDTRSSYNPLIESVMDLSKSEINPDTLLLAQLIVDLDLRTKEIEYLRGCEEKAKARYEIDKDQLKGKSKRARIEKWVNDEQPILRAKLESTELLRNTVVDDFIVEFIFDNSGQRDLTRAATELGTEFGFDIENLLNLVQNRFESRKGDKSIVSMLIGHERRNYFSRIIQGVSMGKNNFQLHPTDSAVLHIARVQNKTESLYKSAFMFLFRNVDALYQDSEIPRATFLYDTFRESAIFGDYLNLINVGGLLKQVFRSDKSRFRDKYVSELKHFFKTYAENIGLLQQMVEVGFDLDSHPDRMKLTAEIMLNYREYQRFTERSEDTFESRIYPNVIDYFEKINGINTTLVMFDLLGRGDLLDEFHETDVLGQHTALEAGLVHLMTYEYREVSLHKLVRDMVPAKVPVKGFSLYQEQARQKNYLDYWLEAANIDNPDIEAVLRVMTIPDSPNTIEDAKLLTERNKKLFANIKYNYSHFVAVCGDQYSSELNPDLLSKNIKSLTFYPFKSRPDQYLINMEIFRSEKNLARVSVILDKEGHLLDKDGNLITVPPWVEGTFLDFIFKKLNFITSGEAFVTQELGIFDPTDGQNTIQERQVLSRRSHWRHLIGDRYTLLSRVAQKHIDQVMVDYGINTWEEILKRRAVGALPENGLLTYVKGFAKEGSAPNQIIWQE